MTETTTITELEPFAWTRGACAGDDLMLTSPIYKHVYASPEGWIAGTDGRRIRRCDIAHGLTRPTLIGGPETWVLHGADGIDRPNHFPEIPGKLFPEPPDHSVTVDAPTLRAYIAELVNTLTKAGIGA